MGIFGEVVLLSEMEYDNRGFELAGGLILWHGSWHANRTRRTTLGRDVG